MRAWRTHSCLPLPPIASGSYKYQGLWPFHLRMRSASPCRRNERMDPLSQTLQGHRGLAGGSVFLIRFQAHCLIWPRSQEKRGREVGPDFFYFFLVCVCMYSEAQQREMSGFCPFFPFLEKREREIGRAMEKKRVRPRGWGGCLCKGDCAEIPSPEEGGFAAKATSPSLPGFLSSSPPNSFQLSPFTVQMALKPLIFAVAILTPLPHRSISMHHVFFSPWQPLSSLPSPQPCKST